jgi:hypothetical protein
MKLLSQLQYQETLDGPMTRVGGDDAPPFDFWPYFEAIPPSDFEGHDCTEGAVSWAWNNASGTFQHVLVSSEDKNVFMVLVLDLRARGVWGHRLLDLNREYGLSLGEPSC